MKKKVFAVGALSIAVAAMPIVGVFAATSDTFTDTLTVNVADSCTIKSSTEGASGAYNRTFSESIPVGQLKSDIGIGTNTQSQPAISISCNSNTGSWTLYAIGAGDGTTVDLMHTTGTGTDIASGTATTGATSNWAFKLAGGNVATGYNNYTNIPKTKTAVVTGNAGTTDVSITPSYQVYIGTAQEPGTYTGKVTYNLEYTP